MEGTTGRCPLTPQLLLPLPWFTRIKIPFGDLFKNDNNNGNLVVSISNLQHGQKGTGGFGFLREERNTVAMELMVFSCYSTERGEGPWGS